jgi:holliday junction DNA helicase RuvA
VIGRLRGELIEIDGSMAIVDAGGVGYEVTMPDSLLIRLGMPGDRVDVITRQIFREDGVSLYGFLEPFQRRLFDLLLSVKGCGPKVGLALIGQLGEDIVASAIVGQDARVLARATGVGARLAERIILELKDKMQEETLHRKMFAAAAPKKAPVITDELVEALIALGCRRAEAEGAAEVARERADSVEEQLKFALNYLRK